VTRVADNYGNNVLTGTTAPVHAAVDKKTQRAAWTVGANKTTIDDVGMSRLTKFEARLLIPIGKDKTRPWLAVRRKHLDRPNADKCL
jgi:hypothetical protein